MFVNHVNEEVQIQLWSTSTHLPEWLKLLIRRLMTTSANHYMKKWNLHILVAIILIKTGIIILQLFPLCTKAKHIIFTIGYISNRNVHTGAQKMYTVLLCYSKNVNLFQCNWCIRKQYDQSTNSTFAYAQSNLWEI